MATTAISALPRTLHVPRPALCTLVMMAGDLAAASLALIAAVLVRHAFDGQYDVALYWRLAAGLALFTAGYGLFGLYPGVGHNPVRELRQLTQATTMVFILFATLLFLFKESSAYSRVVFLVGWLLALVLVPLARTVVRQVYGKRPWWGYPVAIFGSGPEARTVIEGLRAKPELGLHPTAIFHDGDDSALPVAGVPVLGDYHTAPLFAKRLGLHHAIIADPGMSGQKLNMLLESHANVFRSVCVMPGVTGFASFGIETRDVCDTVTLELRRSLLEPSNQFVKRIMDQTVSFLMLVTLFPALALIALIIRLESKGGALFFHRRIGHGGRQFKMWKFRSMRPDGARILEEYLARHPEEQQEWLEKRKLRNDPRVTTFGKILRKTSLDELPQLWNVLCGDMSLVGPRPIVADEVAKYGDFFEAYCRVVPGLTGLWQVSGRSDTDYGKRIRLDGYYVRNWSPWFDIYLLSRTVRVVLRGEGAY